MQQSTESCHEESEPRLYDNNISHTLSYALVQFSGINSGCQCLGSRPFLRECLSNFCQIVHKLYVGCWLSVVFTNTAASGDRVRVILARPRER